MSGVWNPTQSREASGSRGGRRALLPASPMLGPASPCSQIILSFFVTWLRFRVFLVSYSLFIEGSLKKCRARDLVSKPSRGRQEPLPLEGGCKADITGIRRERPPRRSVRDVCWARELPDCTPRAHPGCKTAGGSQRSGYSKPGGQDEGRA